MPWDAHKNLADSRVVTPPSPGISGTTLTVATGEGALFPAVPFNATLYPNGQKPTTSNSEIVRVTNISGDDFTIDRAQEGTTAKDIGGNYYIANTITAKVIEDIETAISNIISAGGGGVSVISAELASVDARVTSADLHASTASTAATNADAHAEVASAAATSVDSRATSILNFVEGVSARSAISATVSTKGLQSVVNALSNRISINAKAISDIISSGGGGTSVTSAELYAVAPVLSLQNVDAAAVSAGAPVYAFTSADTFKRADASATGTELVIGLVMDAAIAISAVGRVQTGGALSLTSAQWSDITSVGTGLTPGDLYYLHSTAGRLTTTQLSAPAVRHIVGQAISPNKMQLMLTPFDDDTSAINALSERVSALETVSARTTAAASVQGLQSILNALSNRISAGGGGGGSVTSQEFSVLNALVSNAISAGSATASAICAILSGVSARSALSATVSTHGLQSVVDALSNRISLAAKAISDIISAGGGGVSVTSAEHASVDARVTSVNAQLISISVLSTNGSSVKGGVQSAFNAISGRISATSAAVTSVDGRVNSVNTALSALSVLSVGAVSTHGLQSVLDALSNRISAAGGGSGSVTSAEHISVDSRVNSVNTFISGISARSIGDVSTHGLQSVINALSLHADNASAAAGSVNNRVTSVNVFISGISAMSGVSATVSTHGLQSVINALSNRISINHAFISNAVSAGSATASAICALLSGISARSAISATVSTHGLQSVVDALSNRISINAQTISNIISAGGGGVSTTSNELSALLAVSARTTAGTSVKGLQSAINAVSTVANRDRMVVVQNIQSVSATALTNISGLVLAVSAGEAYKMDAQVLYHMSISNALGFGLTFPGMVAANFQIGGFNSVGPVATSSFSIWVVGNCDEGGSGSIIWSAAVVSGAHTYRVMYEGLFVVSTAGNLQLQTRVSVSTGVAEINRGSYLRLLKLS